MRQTLPIFLILVGIALAVTGAVFLVSSVTPAQVFEGPGVGFRVDPSFAGVGGEVGDPGHSQLTPQDTVNFNVEGVHGIIEMYLISAASFRYTSNATVFLQNIASNPQAVELAELLVGPTTFSFVPKAPDTGFYLLNQGSAAATMNMTMTTYYQALPVNTYRISGVLTIVPGIALILAGVVRLVAIRTKPQGPKGVSLLSQHAQEGQSNMFLSEREIIAIDSARPLTLRRSSLG